MNSELPKIESKKCSEMYKLLKEMIPHYTPEWVGSDPKDAGIALLKIYSQMNENVINRLNQVPKKNFVAFLDMLGISLLPAQPARVPITFKLAKGTADEILIPERTQVSAGKTDKHEELPFETEQDLLATPSQLKTVVSVDPAKDAIYIPPPGFLDGEIQKQNKITYNIVSSPSVLSDNFQLDNVTDLNPGDFLSLGDTDHEYVVISKISGKIIHITDHLSKDYPSGTPVEKVTKFNLFEGKNMQEHSLYLCHKDLFNIKSTAQFTLFINHRAGAEGALSSLDVSWEYWGEVNGEEGEDWQKFDAVDGTFGLSKDGIVTLNKMKEGEIKEKEINGIKSRWIRCILVKPLDINASLPILDNLVFKLNSSGENLSPDQAFNNDKPIDITKPFAPLGYEPRIFDNFSMASNEVFSKKGAKIEIDIEIEKRELLGSPTAIVYADKIKIFTRGLSGRLAELEIDPNGTEAWKDHGYPLVTRIASDSTPSAVTGAPSFNPNYNLISIVSGATTLSSNFISVFARAENGHLVERFCSGNEWQWIDHGAPQDGILSFDPFSIYDSETEIIYVFIAISNGILYEFQRKPNDLIGKWTALNGPDDTKITCSPFAVNTDYDETTEFKIFATGKNGYLYELNYNPVETNSEKWIPLLSPNSVKLNSRPFAQIYKSAQNGTNARVFVVGTDEKGNDTLCEFDTENESAAEKDLWISLGAPDGNIKISSSPHGYVENMGSIDGTHPEGKHIFVRGNDSCLWERMDDNKWIRYHPPTNPKLTFSPFVLSFVSFKHSNPDVQNGNPDVQSGNPDVLLLIYSANEMNSIVEMRNYNNNIEWNEYKDPNETFSSPVLSWEYWNNKGWVLIKGLKDETANLLKSGRITFDLPEDIEATEVIGQKNFWIRSRLVSGDYGKETFDVIQDPNDKTKQQLVSNKNSIRPPIVDSLKISYTFEASRYPDKTITYNNLEYIDQTEASKIDDKFFLPFVKLEDKVRSLYLGFENYFKGGPIKIYFAAKELPFTEETKPKMEWTYSAKTEWDELDHQDDTEGLINADIMELLMGSSFSAQSRFGSCLYWIKGSLIKGEYEEPPLLDGIYPNTTWALQTGTIKDEILGSSSGAVNQKFSFLNLPVLDGQDVRVNEILSEEEKQAITASLGEKAIKEVKDEKGKIIEKWVQWSEVSDFFDSTRQDRHYTLDHATGQLQFGDGNKGMIPSELDNNIKAFSYQSGGGKNGNVEAGEIKSLKSTIAGVDSVLNPVAADGGADTADIDQMLEIGPTTISHRDRAVTAEDFEWLAKQASRKVVKVKCLTNTNNNGQKELGWVTLIIVPDSKEDKPLPSLELRKEVQSYLESRCENTLAYKKHIHIDSPSYAVISVSADVFVTSIENAFKVDREVKQKLNAFFHPLTGGREQKGWDFGRDVSDSDIYALIENIEGVDHVEKLEVTRNFDKPPIPTSSLYPQYKQSARNCDLLISSTENKDVEPVKFNENFLVANGTHDINLRLMSESDPNGSA